MKLMNLITIASLVIGSAAFAEESVNNNSVPAVTQTPAANQGKQIKKAKHKKAKKSVKADKKADAKKDVAVTPEVKQ